ncbi:hypothetical protein T440DRAFT_471212 [Plenodomus tracheiphilus IPT5]|uniref:Uncharacterized protein n=1 Tax=Plenodomus tracheiphilus IPT5 TaxID=1408161 RepID=A0A6A7AYU2_9PLEO|nr:hypothetical protein T440DRAFT_471212 [Plenodomus tracheiphilus IPT5]
MQFTTLFLAASAAVLSVAAPADMGQWDVIVTEQWSAIGYKAVQVNANFTSPSYPGAEGLTSSCSKKHIPATTNTPAVNTDDCDPGFSYTWEGGVIKLQQVVELPNQMTVFGEAPLKTITGGVGRSAQGQTIVKVTSAIA